MDAGDHLDGNTESRPDPPGQDKQDGDGSRPLDPFPGGPHEGGHQKQTEARPSSKDGPAQDHVKFSPQEKSPSRFKRAVNKFKKFVKSKSVLCSNTG